MSISRPREVVQAAAHVGHAPHDDVEHLLLLEDAADLDALQQRGHLAAHVARLDPVARPLLRGPSRSRAPAARARTRPAGRRRRRPRPRCLHRRSPAAQDVEVLAVDAHDEGLVRARQDIEVCRRNSALAASTAPDVPDPLLLVGHDVAIDPLRRGSHHVLDRCHRRVVVGIGADLDPEARWS